MPILIYKYRIKRLVQIAYHLTIIKGLLIKLESVYTSLQIIGENTDSISDLINKLIAKRAFCELWISNRIDYIASENNISLPFKITHLTKKQLDEGFINLTSQDGLEHLDDKLLCLTDGHIIEITVDNIEIDYLLPNALEYHNIVANFINY